MKQVVNTQAAPAAMGPYSQAIQVGNLVYTSGQIPIDPATGSFVEGGIKEQTRQSLSNVQAILREAGLSMSNVIKTTGLLLLGQLHRYRFLPLPDRWHRSL